MHNWLQQLWLLVVENADFVSHLRTMKEFFLLGRGELFLAFIDTANSMLCVPPSHATHRGVLCTSVRGYSIIGSGSGFTVNLGSDSLGKSNDFGVSSVSRIYFGFGFIVNPDPDLIIE